MGGQAVYAPKVAYLFLPIISTLGLIVAAIYLCILASSMQGHPYYIPIIMFCCIAVGAIFQLGFVSYELRMECQRLYWRSALRKGSVDLADLKSIENIPIGMTMRIQTYSGRSILVGGWKGIDTFASTVREFQPEFQIQTGQIIELLSHLPETWGGYKG